MVLGLVGHTGGRMVNLVVVARLAYTLRRLLVMYRCQWYRMMVVMMAACVAASGMSMARRIHGGMTQPLTGGGVVRG